MSDKPWTFTRNQQQQANWAQGLRGMFEYRDLGISAATSGYYVVHLISAKAVANDVEAKQWRQHDCIFKMVYLLKSWARVECQGLGVCTVQAGECINQLPMIKHREIDCDDDMELMEIVALVNVKITVVAD